MKQVDFIQFIVNASLYVHVNTGQLTMNCIALLFITISLAHAAQGLCFITLMLTVVYCSILQLVKYQVLK